MANVRAPWKEALISVSTGNFRDIPIVPNLIIVHRTGNPGSSPRANRDFFDSPHAGRTSAHIVHDAHEALLCVPLNRYAHHAGNANGRAIGIETCEPMVSGSYDKLLEIVVFLLRNVLRRSGSEETVKPHSWCNPTNRPFCAWSWSEHQAGRSPRQNLYDPFKFYEDIARETRDLLPRPLAHTVLAGETLSRIAARYGVSIADLLRVNPLPNPSLIRPGQVLTIPSK